MGYLKDNIVGYISRNKKWVIFLAVCLIVIFLSSMIASGIQSDGWKVEVTDLRDAENTGTITVTSYDSETQQPVTEEQDVEGKVVSGGIYVNGVLTEVAGGEAAPGAFRAIYEVPGIHPQVHYSVDGAEAVINFFYTAFGTPSGHDYIEESNQTWWVKEMFSFIGMIALFACIFPLVSLLLTTPFFRSLAAKKEAKYAYAPAAAPAEAPAEAPADEVTEAPAEAQVAYDEAPAEPAPEPVKAAPAAAAAAELPAIDEPKPLKGIWKNLTYWLGAAAIMLFSGFIIHDVCTEYGSYVFPNTQLYPQDTTNWVAIWAVVVALFSLGVICFMWLANTVFYRIRYKENAGQYIENPFAAAKINGGFVSVLKSFLLAMVVVFFLYLVTFINWSAWVVDFRIWTLAVKVFNVGDMLPTMVRYAVFFGIFFTVSALFNETYRVKNIPDWATTLINVFFNIFGVILVVAIQYGEFGATGVMWQPEMNLGYIVIIPMIGVLAVATVISRRMAAKTGNMWLGAFINTMLFTIITCANTAASFSYVMG